MGNSHVKRNYHTRHNYASQYSLSDIIGGSCVGSAHCTRETFRSRNRVSRRSSSESTLNDPLGSSKTLWPVPRFEAIFLPEFQVKGLSLKMEYTILNVINKGAYGRVYRVQKQDTRQIFALKVISKARIVAENSVEQAKQEVAIQRVVGHHPFILNSTYRWQGRKTLYILTDYMSGGELYSLTEEYGCLPEYVVKIYVAEIALAIDFLHNVGVVHRDLKATNVLLDEEGHAVIIDFGLAKWLSHTERTNTFCGTTEYMAPEILKRQYYGQAVDWWALGVLACFLLTNQYPSALPIEYPDEHGNPNIYKPVGSLLANAEISPAARDLLKRLLQPEPRLRLRSLLALSRIAFFMGKDLQSYMLKKESPFRLLGKGPVLTGRATTRLQNEFSNFDSSFAGGSTTRTLDHE